MRIGILTFHRAINYGAFLQAFALKTYITKLGHQVEIIDYWPEGHADAYRLIPKSWKKRSLIGKIKFFISLILRYSRTKKRIEGMQYLVEKHFNLTTNPAYLTVESLKNLSYDCIVYGSDQIWWKSTIPNYTGFDPVYWGEYIPASIKKVAYAPSMGIIDLTKYDKELIRKWLCNLSALSVRETGLYEAIHELTNKEMLVVLDPVFLLSRKEWENFCHPVNHHKYILYYNLIPSEEADFLVKKLSKERNCDVLEITGSVKPLKIGKRYLQTVDALDFISLVRNADFVVTSSFHGTAFSIVFEKQFLVIGIGKKSGRVESLLEQLDISDRLNRNIDNIPKGNIDYSIVNKRLDHLIVNSKKYLKNEVGLN